MKIIQSFYQVDDKTCYQIGNSNDNYLVNFYSLLLSYASIKRIYGHVVMYCNKYAYDKILKYIPYDKIVYVDEPDITSNNYKNDWALLKLRVYEGQIEPFIHIDGDVFFFRELLSNFMNGDYGAIVQSVELSYTYPNFFYSNVDALIKYDFIDIIKTTNYINKYKKVLGYNCGVAGFKDMDFMRLYVKRAYEMNRLINDGTLINVAHAPMVYEQFLLHELILKHDIKCYEILPTDDILTKGYNKTGNEHKYTHLLSGNKYVQHFVMLVREKILDDFPEYRRNIYEFESTLNDANIVFINHNKINHYFV